MTTKPRRWIGNFRPKRHVIFLGAGASASSGYPLANELTLLMCDQPTFRKRLARELDLDGDGDHGFEVDSVITRYRSFSQAAALLRDTDFATMDELSRNALRSPHENKVRDLKKLMRLMLALQNPDLHGYATSDYRRFIQKLFVGARLRQDVSIISFNYDPYLEHRLARAWIARAGLVAAADDADSEALKQAIHSGFNSPADLSWLTREGFCHFKMHGTCVLPDPLTADKLILPVQPNTPENLHAGYFFRFQTAPRLACLCQPPFSEQEPPAILPWEIMHDAENRLLNAQEFGATVGSNWQHRALYPLFSGIWNRARREVQAADKVSFVGLSFGPFMEPGMRFLFDGKTGDVQMVVANPQNKRFDASQVRLHPSSPAGHAHAVLADMCGMKCRVFGSSSEYEGFDDKDFHLENHEATVTCHNSFADFIEAEL